MAHMYKVQYILCGRATLIGYATTTLVLEHPLDSYSLRRDSTLLSGLRQG
jgi:hypothetical protein